MEGVLQVIVGANIRRVRSEQGLSQEAFGEQVGWHRTFVGAVERGERNLTLKSVERISDQLGVDPIDLLWDRADAAPVMRAAEGSVPGGEPATPSARRRPRPSR